MIEIIGTDLNQWDVDRSVKVTDVGATHVHFANTGDSKAVIMDAAGPEVMIPNFLLQTGKQLCVYAVANGVTVERKTFPVRKRERPENYIYEEDQRNFIYKLIQDVDDAIAEAKRINAGRITESGGEIFGDYENNEAIAKYAAAFGNASKAQGYAAFVSGHQTYRSGSQYARDSSGRYYVVSPHCQFAKTCDVLRDGYVVVANLGTNYIKTTDGGFIPKSDIIGNEAIGAGSTASGMGTIAFSRASKSMGYRTQAGYPTSPQFLDERPELHVLTEVLVPGKAEPDFELAAHGDSRLLIKGVDVRYISQLRVRMSYQSPITHPTKAYLRIIFGNDCCTDLGVADIRLFEAAEHDGAVDTCVPVPEIATCCDIYGVFTDYTADKRDAYCYIQNLRIDKFPHDNLCQAAFAIGADNAALGKHSFAGGLRCIARGDNSFAFGFNSPDVENPTWTEANGAFSIALGLNCHSNALGSLTFGDSNEANMAYSIALGQFNATNKSLSYALGKENETFGMYSLALGLKNYTHAEGAVAIGNNNSAENTCAVAIGENNRAYGIGSFAAGQGSIAGAKVWDEETQKYKLSGTGAAAFGVGNEANFYGTFSYGQGNVASQYNALAGGSVSRAEHANSAVFGRGLLTGRASQAVVGQWNASNTEALFVIGKGSSETSRSNAFAVKSNGNVLVGGSTVHSGADYAEFFEWEDGNPNAEDRIGLLVSLDGEKIRFAMPGDDVLGVVSGTAAVLGDSAAMHWKGKYLTDEFGRTIYDMVENFIEVPDPETGEMVKESTGMIPQPRLNPDYDPESTYIPREERQEWDQIGMMGKLYTRDDGTCAAGDYGCPGENGVLTRSDTPTNIRIMKRTSDNIVLVLLK